ncbi:MAG: hypothetical protein AAB512_03715 [Patescibacteria group bacterium]
MNQLPYFDINTITLISLAVGFLTMMLVVFVIFRLNKINSEDAALGVNKIIQEKVNRQIEELIQQKVEAIFKTASTKVDAEVNQFIADITKLAQAKAGEIAGFVEKAGQEQVHESQFFVANMLSKVEKEVEVYKKNKMIKVDEEIRQIVLSAAREVIGRAISLSEHEDLVSKALERAKKDKIFT